ncbi:acyl-CoA synthetase [Paracoccus suum]|nr:acyl-CoA synthetase [Paracoccus suum]
MNTLAERNAIEAQGDYADRDLPVTLFAYLTRIRDRVPDRPAISFQLLSGPRTRACTLTWDEYHQRVTECANLLRGLGIGPTDTVAYLLPNCLEAAVVLVAGATAGIVNPINPLLEPEQIGAILRETNAKVLVTLRPFPKSDLAQKAAAAVAMAPDVHTVLQVDLGVYLGGLKRVAAGLMRPRVKTRHHAKVMDFEAEASSRKHTRLNFDDPQHDRIAAYFHTGGTTGMPKVAQHRYSGMIYNGWLGSELLFTEEDVLLCPLPLFHVFAAYPVLMSCIGSGAHMVMPTPAGYRGDGVLDNFWKLVERWQATFLIAVPTAIAALMQRPVDADVSSLRTAISGSAPLPIELYNRFKQATGVEIAEGYGLTECTCLVSCNPIDGKKKVGSVGIPFPYTEVRILRRADGKLQECAVDEIGEICVSNPGVFEGSTYTEVDRNRDLFAEGRFLRTGDLGRLDADGYLWITGRAKDLIIRGGHNLDPGIIEEALMSHPAVAVAGAIGQPDAFAGELPCAYVELVAGMTATPDELLTHCRQRITERAAVPKHIEILPELPKTAVGKVFKPQLRALATARVLDVALAPLGASVGAVDDDKTRGMLAHVRRKAGADEAAIRQKLGEFSVAWEWEQGGD